MSAFDLVVRNALLPVADGWLQGEMAVAGGFIAAIGPGIDGSGRTELDAEGMFLFPGWIDAHVHFNEPGRETWEGFSTGSRALAAGGGTVFFEMPLNASPPTLDAESFRIKRALAEKKSCLDFALWGGLTPLNLDRMPELAECGVIGFKAFMASSGMNDFPMADSATLRKGMRHAAALGLPVAVHAEDETIVTALAAQARKEGRSGVMDYLQARPPEAEWKAIETALGIAGETGCSLHVVHVSTRGGLERIATARRQGVDVTAETCPHYLLLTADDVVRLGAPAKCAPPLRDASEVNRLWSALDEGLIQTLGSDHSPSPPELKEGEDFFAIWGGIAGCQHGLPLLIAECWRRELDPVNVLPMLSANVTARFPVNRRKGRLEPGWDADFSLVRRLDIPELIQPDQLFTRHPISAYCGKQSGAGIERTYVRGMCVHAGQTSVQPRSGTFLRPPDK